MTNDTLIVKTAGIAVVVAVVAVVVVAGTFAIAVVAVVVSVAGLFIMPRELIIGITSSRTSAETNNDSDGSRPDNLTVG